MELDERILVANQWARNFDSKGYYTDTYPGSNDFVKYWDFLKKIFYTGLLIDGEYYVSGDAIWYLNFIPIPDKIKKRPAFPTLYDTDIWWFQLLELAKLENKFTVTLKKRQCIVGDSVVYTPNGLMTIESMVDNNYKGEIYSYEDGEIVIDNCLDAFYTKEVESYYRVTLENGMHIECTYDHQIMSTKGWKKAIDTKEGTKVVTKEGISQVTELHHLKYGKKVYDLTTENTGNFIANGIVVHNCGFSLKACAKILKRAWFEEAFSGKVTAWDDNYNTTNWTTLEDYRAFLNEHTAWYRPFEPDKTGFWKQVDKESNKGLRSILKVANTKKNAASVVSGKTDEILFDEAGIAPNLNDTVGFVEPALRQGDIVTGEMHVFGAVGKLDKCEPFKRYFFKPESGNFLALPNIWSNRPSEKVGIFVPEHYSFGSYIDEFGNSDTEGAKKFIGIEAERIKDTKGYTDYMLYKSQHPTTPEDCFNIRTKNIFPIEIIKPHYESLLREYDSLVVTLKENDKGVYFDLGSQYGIVTDYPVKFESKKEGAVVIDEPPMEETPQFGAYYAATDPIKPINTQSSESLQSTYIYKAAHEIDGEYAQDKLVAWYTGRYDDPYETYEISLKLVKLYNARWAIESDQPAFIEWLIGKKEGHRLMKRSEMPILKEWVPKSQINEEIGWRTGSGGSAVKNRLLESIVMYCKEIIGTTFNPDTGESQPIYGVTRIKDFMLLKEMLDYGGNADRLIAFGGVLMAARSNTNRGIVVTRKGNQDEQELREQAIKQYSKPKMKSFTKMNSLKRRYI